MKVLIAVDGSDPAMRACEAAAVLLVPERDEVRLVTVLSYSLYPYSGIPEEPLADEAERRGTSKRRSIASQTPLRVSTRGT
jgi:nucleotide-binding universal stress UspA family protein